MSDNDSDDQFNADLAQFESELYNTNSNASTEEDESDNAESGESGEITRAQEDIPSSPSVSGSADQIDSEAAADLDCVTMNAVTATSLGDRGGGSRYFVDMSAIVCRFCRRQGHMFRDCKEKATRCHLCREDHDPLRCPLADLCYSCFQRGHQRGQCPSIGIRKYCYCCTSSGHSTRECTRVWRQYRFTKDTHRRSRDVSEYCYMCGKEGHFGDNCSYSRNSFRSSAFYKDCSDTSLHQIEPYRPTSFKTPPPWKDAKSNGGAQMYHGGYNGGNGGGPVFSMGYNGRNGGEQSFSGGYNEGNGRDYATPRRSNVDHHNSRNEYRGGNETDNSHHINRNHNRFNVRDRRQSYRGQSNY
ncbi:hypothetical protein BASA50_003907 [Batrachochytrium salamandrivorans]|uniref:CCHC-type domain-containing protein n=1 Tax=Batrachochytrium salamandrivorans TaxID=1357716 RepID=A0ABQ8FKF3_9FUNG|nr:hypothetical protein BASA50_003907 [Batrachochytrium salamandrivorans]KAH6602964.1 hypothetical protein BASA61_000590 [Batrachochytrium salamandrivorans]KAH9265913.1 hypothetical protein BASA84_001373 [Batrachochytrium salamandrivorans]KAH9276075.1 hypothetical protein BASA83_001348 [Batrachochytrium salamandrivorans]